MGITSKNSNLTKAKAAKNDEFYTQYSDIEAELSHYEVKHFADRVVYLPCDDWHLSQFIKYFEDNFTRLQLKALVATGINFTGAGYYYKKTSEGVVTGVLEGNGDFRSDACRQLMREADIIVTNPPFSLFREFVAQIMEMRKQFIVWANMGADHYIEIFPHIQKGTIRHGTMVNKACIFKTPDGSENKVGVSVLANIGGRKEPDPVLLTRVYREEDYNHYMNFDAIDVPKIADIPCDYFGVMGVPNTFLSQLNRDQFEIFGWGDGKLGASIGVKPLGDWVRVLKEQGGTGHYSENMTCLAYYDNKTGEAKRPYARLLIKRKTIPVEAEFLQSFVDGVERRS